MTSNFPNPIPGDPVKADHIRALALGLRHRTPRPSSTVKVVELGDNGFCLEVIPTGVAIPPPNYSTWAIRSDKSIVPGLVGGKMPTLGGTALDAATPPTLTLGAGTVKVYFKLSFTTTFTNGYLTAATLDTVEVIESIPAPTDTSGTTGIAVKHLQFNTAIDGVPTTSFFNTSIPVTLWDNGYEATTLRYGNL
jgi:hypothetical protein